MAKYKRKEYEATNEENPVPGKGTLYGAEGLRLQETTVLNNREVYAFATNFMRRKMLDPKWKKEPGETWVEAVMRMKKSVDGRGIDDIKELYHVSTEEKAAEINKGAMFG